MHCIDKDILALHTEESQYNIAVKDTIFESSDMRNARLKEINEDLGTTDYAQSPNSYCHFDFPFGKLIGGLLGLIAGALAGIGMLISRAIALRKIKNLMIKLKYWTEYGYHKKVAKGSPLNIASRRWFKSETDKDFPSYTSMFCATERDLTCQTEVLLKALGLRDDSKEVAPKPEEE